ncbi:MAG TPA: AmmeMemoRadiSam system protein B [Blastocatellia bacterium]|nr:AmmeMemoRadiSam system protein B [Blastocatellia bacterium]HMX26026.1 AmmeMemoRadiSam system protein B [Blastocatellia bacterium]HMZ21478.1 AmmeMemoRadiSam system protein B [Blastocatellia bacterium]HNG28925.1 AmmeMemoRadiSam system protein B [Blastocatellia bacterium]
MSKQLPRLRRGLDMFPSPVAERPGLVLRDPFRYSDEMLIIPPLLAAGLSYFDGESTVLDVQAYLTRLVGQLVPGEIIESLTEVMQQNGFLETEEYERLRRKRHAEFAAAPVRLPVHAGSGYPDQTAELRAQLDDYLKNDLSPAADPIIGLAAPHVSPFGGWQSYAAAYGRLSGAAKNHAADKTVVVLGTSHYGQPERFGLTRKPFVTPLGTIQPDLDLIDELTRNADGAILREDYCHSMEHSIEFQCVFLQQMLGSDFKILPVLCGPFAKALYYGEPPENDDQVLRFFDALGELAELHRSKLFWVLGIDLAHIGRRYGDDLTAVADEGEMLEVKEEDHERLQHVCDGNTEEFFELVKPEEDRLKWCGFSPLYTFLNVVPEARGKVLNYEQWNIDEQSVVSFAAMEFV